VTVMSILGLVASPPGRIAGGEVIFKGRDLLKLTKRNCNACVAARSRWSSRTR